jgi:hypothetical protein
MAAGVFKSEADDALVGGVPADEKGALPDGVGPGRPDRIVVRDGALVEVPLVSRGEGEFIALLDVRGGPGVRGDKLAGPGADEGLEFFQVLELSFKFAPPFEVRKKFHGSNETG